MLDSRYRVRLDCDMFTRQGYLAGSDQRRADEFNRYLRDPDVRAIILARGGYGITRMLESLDASALRRDPKLVIGFSDATALLAWADRCAGVRGIHGPMVKQLGELPPQDTQWLFQLMESPSPAGVLPLALQPIGAQSPAPVLEGPLVGGNLCLLAHLAGTPYDLDYTGGVLVLEEYGERPYRVDRYLTQLGLTGALDRVACAVIGDLTDCRETVHADHPGPFEVVDERLSRHGVPGLRGLPVGHARRNLALPVGGRCAVLQREGKLHLLDAAVAPP